MKNEACFRGLIVEKFQLVRSALRQTIGALSCIQSVVAIEDTSEIHKILQESAINVIILGTSTSLTESINTMKIVKQHDPHLKVIAFAKDAAPEMAQALARSGIDSILDKTATEQDLRNAVTACHSGNTFYSSTIHEKILFSSRKVGLLTPCEMQVLAFILQGATNHLISKYMYITIKTVEAHVTRIYRKLDVSSRSQAILRAQEMYPSLKQSV